jgi:hypothetical protein
MTLTVCLFQPRVLALTLACRQAKTRLYVYTLTYIVKMALYLQAEQLDLKEKSRACNSLFQSIHLFIKSITATILHFCFNTIYKPRDGQ